MGATQIRLTQDRGEKLDVNFLIPGTPKPDGRPRATPRGVMRNRSADGWKQQIRSCVQDSLRDLYGVGSLASFTRYIDYVELVFYMPRPKTHLSKDGLIKSKYLDARHVKRPDLDNLVKAVLDSLQAFDRGPAILWADDCVIHSMDASKKYSVLLPNEVGPPQLFEGLDLTVTYDLSLGTALP
ncbi:MAG: RusA family crossover junction endodeoxyribonuclease [Nannocystaceae bacterium]